MLEDDFRRIARKMIAADALVFATPTYMDGMSAVLKMFSERLISVKTPPVDSQKATKSLEECFALLNELADGRRDISNKDILSVAGQSRRHRCGRKRNRTSEYNYILNLYGFILPPQGLIYHTGHSMQPLEDLRRCFFENRWLQAATVTMARAMVQLIQATKPVAWVQMHHLIENP